MDDAVHAHQDHDTDHAHRIMTALLDVRHALHQLEDTCDAALTLCPHHLAHQAAALRDRYQLDMFDVDALLGDAADARGALMAVVTYDHEHAHGHQQAEDPGR